MPLQARCPKCAKLVAVPDSLLGKPVRCPGCQSTFTIAAPTAAPPVAITAVPLPPPPPVVAQPKQATTPDDFSWEPAARDSAPAASPIPVAKPAPGQIAEIPTLKATDPNDFSADFGPREEKRPSRHRPAEGFEPWTFKAQIQRDLDKKLKGILECQVTGEGVWLKQGDQFYVLVAVPSPVTNPSGNKLIVEIEGRKVELAVSDLKLYQTRVARELALFLTGKGRPPMREECVVPPALYVLAFLPVGIPIITLGGAIWGGLAGLLVGTCFAIIRREQWPLGARIALALFLTFAGYGALGVTYLVNNSPKGPGNNGNNVQRRPKDDRRDDRFPEGPDARQPETPQPGELLRIKTEGGLVWQVRFSSGVRTLATLGRTGICELWEAETGKKTGSFRAAHPEHINWVSYSPFPGKYLVGWSGQPELLLRESRTGDILGRCDMGDRGSAYAMCEFFPDGNRMVACTDGAIRFFSVPDCKPLKEFNHIQPPVNGSLFSVNVSRDGTALIAGGRDGQGRHDLVWDLTKQEGPRQLKSFSRSNQYARMTLSPKGDLAMTFNTRFVELVDWKTDRLVLMKEAPVQADFSGVAITPLGNMLITGHYDSHVRFWELPSGKELGKLKIGSKNDEPIMGIAVSPDDRFLTTARQEVVTIWETKDIYPR